MASPRRGQSTVTLPPLLQNHLSISGISLTPLPGLASYRKKTGANSGKKDRAQPLSISDIKNTEAEKKSEPSSRSLDIKELESLISVNILNQSEQNRVGGSSADKDSIQEIIKIQPLILNPIEIQPLDANYPQNAIAAADSVPILASLGSLLKQPLGQKTFEGQDIITALHQSENDNGRGLLAGTVSKSEKGTVLLADFCQEKIRPLDPAIESQTSDLYIEGKSDGQLDLNRGNGLSNLPVDLQLKAQQSTLSNWKARRAFRD